MKNRKSMVCFVAALVAAAGHPTAGGQAPTVPWIDQAASLDPERGVLAASAVGRPDPRFSRMAARRHSARVTASRRARQARKGRHRLRLRSAGWGDVDRLVRRGHLLDRVPCE